MAQRRATLVTCDQPGCDAQAVMMDNKEPKGWAINAYVHQETTTPAGTSSGRAPMDLCPKHNDIEVDDVLGPHHTKRTGKFKQ